MHSPSFTNPLQASPPCRACPSYRGPQAAAQSRDPRCRLRGGRTTSAAAVSTAARILAFLPRHCLARGACLESQRFEPFHSAGGRLCQPVAAAPAPAAPAVTADGMAQLQAPSRHPCPDTALRAVATHARFFIFSSMIVRGCCSRLRFSMSHPIIPHVTFKVQSNPMEPLHDLSSITLVVFTDAETESPLLTPPCHHSQARLPDAHWLARTQFWLV